MLDIALQCLRLMLVERLLREANLPDQIGKMGAGFGTSVEGIRELLRQLFSDHATVTALTRQVAFLFDFEKVRANESNFDSHDL